MKAVIGTMSGIELNTIHEHVIEIECLTANKRYKCLDCGLIFKSGVNSPSIIKDNEVKYFSDYKKCTQK